MDGRQARRFLIVAFLLSLLIHLVVATGVQWPFAAPKENVQVVRVEHLHTLRVSRVPTPPPHTPPPNTPSPQPSAAATTANVAAPAHPGKPAGEGPGRPAGGGGRSAPPPTPTPNPSPTQNCALNDTQPALASSPPPPDIAPAARGDATNGTTRVRVALDAEGAVQQASIVQSSGNSSLDLVAVTMARAARYTPATHACKPVAGEYVFSAKFVAW